MSWPAIPTWFLLLPPLVVFGLFVPWRHHVRVSWTRKINAPAEELWERVVDEGPIDENTPADERGPFCSSALISSRLVCKDPETWENIHEFGELRRVDRLRSIEKIKNESLKFHVESVDGVPSPYGENSYVQIRLRPSGDKTFLKHTAYTRSDRLYQSLQWFWSSYLVFSDVQAHYSTAKRPGVLSNQNRSIWLCLIISLIAVASFAYMFGWALGLIVAATTVIHEFGHWLAMRLTGQPTSQFLLIPFFGGLAVAKLPHKTLFHDAFCTLMGPGLSAAVCALLLAAHFVLGAPTADVLGILQPGQDTALDQLRLYLMYSIVAISFLNITQLIPLLPLDGGHLLRTVTQSLNVPFVRWTLFGLAAVATLFCMIWGQYVIALFAAFGVWLGWWAGKAKPRAIKLSWRELFLLSSGTAATLAIYLFALNITFAQVAPLLGLERLISLPLGSEIDPGHKGSYKVEPAFSLQSGALQSLRQRTYVSGSRSTGSRYEWRSWGKTSKPETNFTISVGYRPLRGRLKHDLKARIGRIQSLRRHKLTFDNNTQYIDLDHARFNSVGFLFESAGTQKHCIGFHGMLDANAYYITGWYCAAPDKRPSKSTLRCLIGRLDIYASNKIKPYGIDVCQIEDLHAANTGRSALGAATGPGFYPIAAIRHPWCIAPPWGLC